MQTLQIAKESRVLSLQDESKVMNYIGGLQTLANENESMVLGIIQWSAESSQNKTKYGASHRFIIKS